MIRTILLALALGLGVSGCNTVAGVGEDISAGARTIQRTF